MTERLTPAEEGAILVALAASLASPVLDGFDDDDPSEQSTRRTMLAAQTKLWRRQEARERRRGGLPDGTGWSRRGQR